MWDRETYSGDTAHHEVDWGERDEAEGWLRRESAVYVLAKSLGVLTFFLVSAMVCEGGRGRERKLSGGGWC